VSSRVLPHLVTVADLVPLLGRGDVRVVDVRWRLGDPAAGPAAYARGHLPGAVFADVDRDLAGEPGERGRHPLPSADAFEGVMRRLGIGDGTRVVAYDEQGGATAARLWFLLRYFGHETGAVLDGGIEAFTSGGHALETSVPEPVAPASPFHAVPRREMIVERAELARDSGHSKGVLLDARAGERFRGEVEPIDPRAGHIPGAVSAPFAGNLAGGRMLPRDALLARYRALGAASNETVAYCGSGVTACHDLLALAVVGFEGARLYAGSWSEWSRDPGAKVATGG